MEQEEYRKEKINWSYIEYIDNQDVLDLIEKVFSHFICQIFCYILPGILMTELLDVLLAQN